MTIAHVDVDVVDQSNPWRGTCGFWRTIFLLGNYAFCIITAFLQSGMLGLVHRQGVLDLA